MKNRNHDAVSRFSLPSIGRFIPIPHSEFRIPQSKPAINHQHQLTGHPAIEI
jgi:hypothetical protein